jgi:hypothetical protein
VGKLSQLLVYVFTLATAGQEKGEWVLVLVLAVPTAGSVRRAFSLRICYKYSWIRDMARTYLPSL